LEKVRASGPPKVKRNAYYPVPGKVKVSKELGKLITIFAHHTKKAVDPNHH
jgi:hypothetical protein